MTIKEEIDLPVDAPLIEDIDGSLAVELDTILESSEPVVEPVSEDVAVVTEGSDKDDDDDKGDDNDDDDDKGDEDDVKESFEVALEVGAGDIDLSEDVEAIFGDESLTEEFKTKATGIFEAAVTARVNESLSVFIEKVNTESKEKFAEATEKQIEVITEKVDTYLDSIVEDWADANKLAIESKLMVKLSESFMSGMKNLFEAHYVNPDNMQVDVIKSLSEENEGLNTRLSEQLDTNVKLKNAVISERRKRIVESASVTLSDEQKEKFGKLAEAVVFTGSEDFTSRLVDIKEAYFAEEVPVVETAIIVNSVELDDVAVVTESVEHEPKQNAGVAKTLKYLNK